MNNPVCAACGQVNRPGALACAVCGARPHAADGRGAAGGFGGAREPFDTPGAWSPAEQIPAPPFKGAGSVISPMLAVYRKHFTLVGVLVLVTMVPQALLEYGVMDAAGGASRSGGGFLLLWVLRLVTSSLLSGSLVYAVVELQRAGRSSAGECLARGLKVLPKVFLVSLLYTTITVLGYVLLVVPGIIFSLMFAVCVPAAVLEGRGVMDSLKRSYRLTDGYKGLLLETYFLWGLLVLALNGVLIWSFARGTGLDPLPATVLQTSVLGMLNSSSQVLTVYVYLGLLRERHGSPAAAAG